MWNNYLILTIRKYKSWSGLALVNLIAIIAGFGLIVVLVRGLLLSYSIVVLAMVLLILLIIAITYMNLVTLHLRSRGKEIYIRKLLGAQDKQIRFQLLFESSAMTSFMAISGMVLAEIVTPYCSDSFVALGAVMELSLLGQSIIIAALIIAVGLVPAYFPIQNYIRFVNKNLSRLSRKF